MSYTSGLSIRRYTVFTILLLALASRSGGQSVDPSRISTYPDKNVTLAGIPVKFRSEPKGRGTVGIVLSCLVTFFFCIWGAVHPNIVVGARFSSQLFYKAVIMFTAIVIPEGLILFAFSQYRLARELHKEWLKHYPSRGRWWRFWKGSDDRFGMEGAFFVVMGGFVLDIDRSKYIVGGGGESIDSGLKLGAKASGKSTEEDLIQVILTPVGFKHLLEIGLITEKTLASHRQSIIDKGKASSVAKALAGGQALWLIMQCCARWAAGLPVTLLELHVGIQVICTMIIYICWWEKPLDVRQHIMLKLEDSPANRAADTSEQEAQPHWFRPYGYQSLAADHPDTESLGRKPPDSVHPGFVSSDFDPEEDKLAQNWSRNLRMTPYKQKVIVKGTPPDLIAITAKALYDISYCLSADWREMFAEAFLVVLVGVLHIAAWNFYFPSELARILWRASSVSMCVLPMLIAAGCRFAGYYKDIPAALWEVHLGGRHGKKRGFWGFLRVGSEQVMRMAQRYGHAIPQNDHDSAVRGGRSQPMASAMTFLHHLYMYCGLCALGAYGVSIITITVISISTVRDLPAGAYDTPRWTDYLPHL